MAKRQERVIRVIDGDTFLTASRKRSVRLAGVDAPGKGTKGATKATKALRNLIEGKKVEIHPIARDTYGRTLANVRISGKSVNKAVMNRMH